MASAKGYTRPGTSSPEVQRLLGQIREVCGKRGASGIKGLGRTFRIYDDDRSRSLSYEEFTEGLHDYGIHLKKSEYQLLFTTFDRDGSGSLDFDEFLFYVRPKMSAARVNIIDKAFAKLDRTGDGVVTLEDLNGVYEPTMHPKFKSGEWSKKRVFEEFLKSFQPHAKDRDDKVTRQEFLDYYAGVSSSVDNDAHFDLIIRTAWKL